MIAERWILGFIGHRRVPNPDPARSAIFAALSAIQKEIEAKGGQLELYLSCAVGSGSTLHRVCW